MCPSGYSRVATGSCHRTINTPLDWLAAEQRCERDGGHLVVPDSLEEALLVPAQSWLGLSSRRTAGVFLTVTGKPLAFTYWEMGEPAPTFPCALQNGARWQTAPCEIPAPFACEVDGKLADPAAF